MRVIILQVTTAGSISGTLNYQVSIPLGSGVDAEYYNVTFNGPGNFDSAGAIPLGTIGCTDESAANYCPDAVEDDGSCFDEYIGCTDPTACNYSSTATVNDVSLCIYPTPWACDCQGGPGAIGRMGCNFDPDASCEDLCIYPDLCGICGCDNCYPACTDPAACNYDPNAACDDGTCEYPEEGYNCEGQCLEALTSPGCLCYDYDCPSCDLLDLQPPGRSDPTACNYDPLWNCLVQLCEYPEVGLATAMATSWMLWGCVAAIVLWTSTKMAFATPKSSVVEPRSADGAPTGTRTVWLACSWYRPTWATTATSAP